MKTIIAGVAIALATASSFAWEPAQFTDNIVTSKSRIEVRAEFDRAIAGGDLATLGEAGTYPLISFTPTLSRAEVRAELRAALARGENFNFGESSFATNRTSDRSDSHAAASTKPQNADRLQ